MKELKHLTLVHNLAPFSSLSILIITQPSWANYVSETALSSRDGTREVTSLFIN